MTSSHGRSGRPWRTLRLEILARDPWCQIRGPKCTGKSTTVDHVIPLSQRPDLAHDPANLRGACGPCNYRGGARLTNARARARRAQQPPKQLQLPNMPPPKKPWNPRSWSIF